jgi:hypothetical protein
MFAALRVTSHVSTETDSKILGLYKTKDEAIDRVKESVIESLIWIKDNKTDKWYDENPEWKDQINEIIGSGNKNCEISATYRTDEYSFTYSGEDPERPSMQFVKETSSIISAGSYTENEEHWMIQELEIPPWLV